jgi:hypothetical protein
LVSSHFLEWRTLLAHLNNKQNLSIEMMGTGAESKLPGNFQFITKMKIKIYFLIYYVTC